MPSRKTVDRLIEAAAVDREACTAGERTLIRSDGRDLRLIHIAEGLRGVTDFPELTLRTLMSTGPVTTPDAVRFVCVP